MKIAGSDPSQKERIVNVDGSEMRADEEELLRLRAQNVELQKEVALLRADGNRTPTEVPHARIDQHLHALETALTHSQDFNYVFDSDGRFTYVNRPLLLLWQKTLGDVVGKTFSELDYSPELSEKLNGQIQKVISTQQPLRDETSYVSTSGVDGFYEYIFVPVIGPDGAVEAVSGSTRDITDRKRAEDALRQSEARFSAAFAQAPVGMILTTPEWQYVEVNQAFLDMLGHTKEELVALGVDRVTHPDDVPVTHQYAEAHLKGDYVPPILEKRYLHKDGHHISARVSAVMRRDAAGQPAEFLAIVENITDRKRVEKALAASQAQLQQLFLQAPVAIVVFRGRDLVVEFANPFYQAFLPGRQLEGRRFKDIMPELDQDVLDALNRVLDTGEAFTASDWLIPYDRNGVGVVENAWFNCVFNPLREPDGVVSGIVVVCSEETVQLGARKALEQANKELEEFAYVASHDLQEPLRMVNIYTQLMARDLQPYMNDTSRDFAAQVAKGIKRMDQLLKDLLNFCRAIHTEKDESSVLQSADLNASLAQALNTLQIRIEAEGAVIITDFLPSVRGDESQLAQVFQNLVSNALKYRKTNDSPIVKITSRREGSELVVSVQDNGIGFSQEYADRVFGLFKRLHKDEYPGTGLGLAICKRIVERSGGRIWANSVVGEGSTFSFTLPESANK